MSIEWFLESYSGEKVGPVGNDEAKAFIERYPESYAWRAGFSDWKPVAQVTELTGSQDSLGAVTSAPPSRLTEGRTNKADEIDYEIFGEDIQYVEIELDPEESAISEAGAMMYKDVSIVMDTVFGDSSGSKEDTGGFFDKLVGAGKRLVTGESLFTTVFTHKGEDKARVAFAAPYPGRIIPVDLSQMGGTLICQKDCFLCAAKGVSIGIYFQKKILTGLFGGEGFIMQKLEGDGMAFIHAGGMLKEISLEEGEKLHLDTGCLVAMEPRVKFDIEQAGGIKTAFFGGEGFFFANLQGPGKVWVQSLPFSRLAGRMLSAAPQYGGSDKGEGSALGMIGDMVMGDRFN
ncbi:AIM24 family protein [Sulfurovum mangrovi]|uniref:AIM24 family protein n=1 Tax=Sulfurovum mangrovi TaxID=2893889 RepID=UPI001E4054B1|nr:AIM24 family protein [Sulfurovum mangrovi]